MSQGKKDKFLPIFFGALGLGVVLLGYLGFSASSSADEAEAKFKAKQDDLEALQNAPISRTEDNARKKREQVEVFVKKVQDLGKVMETYQVPINQSENNTSFQAKLSNATTAIKEAAAGRKVTLDAKFDFGMGRYLSDFPVAGAAPRLSAQLDGLVALTNAAIEAGVLEINALTRKELPFETEKKEEPAPGAKPPRASTSTAARPAGRAAARKDAAPVFDESKVLERQPITMVVTGKNDSILGFLQSIANATPGTNPHFFVIRTLKVENEQKDGPLKGVPVVEEEKPDPDNKTGPPIKRDGIFLLGNEKVKAHLELDLVRFLPQPVEEDRTKPASRGTARPANASDEKEKTTSGN